MSAASLAYRLNGKFVLFFWSNWMIFFLI